MVYVLTGWRALRCAALSSGIGLKWFVCRGTPRKQDAAIILLTFIIVSSICGERRPADGKKRERVTFL